MQEQLHRLGQGEGWGTRTTGRPQRPCQDAGALGSSASSEAGEEDRAASPRLEPDHFWPGSKPAQAGPEPSQPAALGSVEGWHSSATWKGPA